MIPIFTENRKKEMQEIGMTPKKSYMGTYQNCSLLIDEQIILIKITTLENHFIVTMYWQKRNTKQPSAIKLLKINDKIHNVLDIFIQHAQRTFI